MTLAVIALFGVLIGLSLGAVGAGGSILAVPVLVYVGGETPSQATTSALVVVFITSLVAVRPHWVSHRVRLDLAVPFGVAGTLGAVVGKTLSERVDPDVLMLGFSGLMMFAALLMSRRATRATRPAAPCEAVALASESSAGKVLVAPPEVRTTQQRTARVLPVGAFVGVMTGFFGVGGGFVIVPALVLVLGVAMTEAVGTSLLIIAINSVVAFVLKSGVLTSGGVDLDWPVVVTFSAVAGLSALGGASVTQRWAAPTLTRWFVVGVLAVAAYTAARSIAEMA